MSCIAGTVSTTAPEETTVSRIWPFNAGTDASYVFDPTLIELVDGVCRLRALDQTDSDNTAGGFSGNGFIHNQTQWNAVSSRIELTAAGMAAGVGNFTSRIMNATASVNWTNLAWTTSRPYLKELPNLRAIETAYTAGNVDMSNNVLLTHMNETSWNGTASEVVDSSGQANHGTSSGGISTAAGGLMSYAGSFDGRDDLVTIADAASLRLTNSMTLEFWMKPSATFNSLSNESMGLIDKGFYNLRLEKSDGTLRFSLYDSSLNSLGGVRSYNGTASDILSFVPFRGKLYAGQGSGAGAGDVLMCNPALNGIAAECEAADWSTVYNGAQETIHALVEYNGRIYAGQGNGAGDGDILMCNPANAGNANDCDSAADWSVVYNGASQSILAFVVFNGVLYAGQGSGAGAGDVLICNPAGGLDPNHCDHSDDWSVAYNGAQEQILSFAVYNGKLYAGQGSDLGDGDVLVCDPAVGGNATLCDDAADWSIAFDGSAFTIPALAVYKGYLYAGQGAMVASGNIYVCKPATAGHATTCDDPADWTLSYLNGDPRINSFAVFSGRLYAGKAGTSVGAGDLLICRAESGSDSAVCDAGGVGDWLNSAGPQEAFHALTVFNGKLYAGQGTGAGDGDIFSTSNNSWVVRSAQASWSSTAWTHIAATYDGTTMRLYVNGTESASLAGAFTTFSNAFPLMIGNSYGSPTSGFATAEPFAGLIDEVAIFNRPLSAAEVLNHYRRGALRLKFQVRSCDDAACAGETFIGPDGTGTTYYSEVNNSLLTLPNISLTNVPSNQWFQYRAFFETDDTTLSPEFTDVVVGPAHYDATGPSINPKPTDGVSYKKITGLKQMPGTANAGTMRYQLSPDNGTTWYWFTGSAWAPAATGYVQSNDLTTIQSSISLFPSPGTAPLFRAFLKSNGSQRTEIDQVELQSTR